MQSPPGPQTVIDGRCYLYFGGTGYLGLQGHPAVAQAACAAMQQYGIGSATTRAWFGDMPPTRDVERLAARFFAAEDAFYFASGYLGSQILLEFLAESFEVALVDQRCHFSVRDAVRRTGRPVFEFGHRDADDLQRALRQHVPAGGRPLVASDGVFSVLGTIAPVADYCRVLGNYPGALLLLDDAHGVGVLGAEGRGTLEHAGLGPTEVNTLGPRVGDRPALLLVATLSKALGGFGGITAGSREFIARLKAKSHFFAGASQPPVPAAAASAQALQLVMDDPGLRARLRENVRHLKHGLQRLGLAVDDTPVPIVCLTLGDGANMQRIQRGLADRGILVAYAGGYSGVAAGGALRLAVFANHTPALIDQLLSALAAIL
jgi:glycine C-acetyltransferase/8-amino-7-oxononanoate synthase